MGNVPSAIQNYITNYIQLDQRDISTSATTRNWLVNSVIRKIDNASNEPVLYNPKKYLNFGSSFKKTKVKVVDEFDVMLIIDTCGGYYFENGITTSVGQGSAFPNHLFDSKYLFPAQNYVSPIKVLNWLKAIVKSVLDPQGADPPVRDNQAVTAYISSTKTTIDLVPAPILKRNSDNKTFYVIPQGGQSMGWIATAPEDDMKTIEDYAKNRSNFRNVIRILKRIKDTYNFVRVSSFAMETIVNDYVWYNDWYQDLYRDCRGALSHLSSIFKVGSILDPFSRKNLLAEANQLNWYAERVDSIISTLDNCLFNDDQNLVNKRVADAFENK